MASTADKLRKLAATVDACEQAAYQKGYADALTAVEHDFAGRHARNPELRMRPESIQAVIRSHRKDPAC